MIISNKEFEEKREAAMSALWPLKQESNNVWQS